MFTHVHSKLCLLLFILYAGSIHAQLIPNQSDESTNQSPATASLSLQMNLEEYQKVLSKAPFENSSTAKTPALVQLPYPDGTLHTFNVLESPILAPSTALFFPNIKTYLLKQPNNPSVWGRLTMSQLGIHALIFTPTDGSYRIEPSTPNGSSKLHYVYFSKNLKDSHNQPIRCGLEDDFHNAEPAPPTTYRAGDCQLRTYRMAVAATGEYTTWAGSVANAVANITATVNNVNAIYERDGHIRLILVTNASIIFSDPTTDPYPTLTFPDGAYLTTNHNTLDTNIGSANYDVGHVFSAEWNGGLAQRPAVCSSTGKGRAASGMSGNPSGSVMEGVVAHETAHQFNVRHTHGATNGQCGGGNSSAATAWEPGGGSTIMAYAGVCTGNSYQNNSDLYFHAGSIAEMTTYAISTSCPVVSTINTAPSITAAASSYNVPASTPFYLTATATDNGSGLTYTWEQMDAGTSGVPPVSTATSGPNFRSYLPSTSPTRYFPALSYILNNTSNPYEVLSSVARTLNFRGTVRDNQSGGGCTDEVDVAINVVATTPFLVTSQNSPTTLTANGSNTFTITWDVSGTNAAPISCSNVKISFSTDGGYNYNYIFSASTSNDGSETFTVPNLPTTVGRIKVECADNIFFDINNANITISSSCAANAAPFSPTTSVSQSQGSSALNLTMSSQYGSIITPLSGTLASTDPGASLAVVNNGSGCITFGNTIKYDLYNVQVNVTGSYTISLTAPFGTLVALYTTSYDPANRCTNFITSSGNYNGSTVLLGSSITATLTAGLSYVLLVHTFSSSQPTLPASYTVDVTAAPTSGALYNGIPTPVGFTYTYVVVDNATGNIVGFDNDTNADLSTYPVGTYTIYGLSHNSASLSTFLNTSYNTFLNTYVIGQSGSFCGSISSTTRSVTITCSAPDRIITVCPREEYLAETTAGKGNSTTNWSCASALSGNDVLYQIDVPTGTTSIYVALDNVSATVRLIWLGTSCSTTCVDTHTSSEGACQYTFATPSAGTYYLVVDHANASDVTYDIAFGGVLAANNTTDTRGSWWFDVDCTSPSFKRNFNVTWGGTDMTFPLTLSPLNVQNTLCTEVFFKNPTGQEGLRQAVFTFDADLSGLTLATPTIPGFYNAGTWYGTVSGQTVTWTFAAADGSVRGDFDGSPNTCLGYEFCVQLTPLSNDPLTTNVVGVFYPDGWGAVGCSLGCCASFDPTCCVNNAIVPITPLSIDFNDPAPLPITLLSFQAKPVGKQVQLSWTTASELNNKLFEVQHATDGLKFATIGTLNGMGTTSTTHSYEMLHTNPVNGNNFYRLAQVDYDNTKTYSKVEVVQFDAGKYIIVTPNPLHDIMHIQFVNTDNNPVVVELLNTSGQVIHRLQAPARIGQNELPLNVQHLSKGSYIVRLTQGVDVLYTRFVKL